MKQQEVKYIRCPHCGAEYLPAEIFLPNELLGYPTDIEKAYDGKIVSYSGQPINTVESYECDKCGKLFKTRARLTFETELDSKYDFNEDYISPTNKKIALFEAE